MSTLPKLDEFHDKEYRIVLHRLIKARLDIGLTQVEVANQLGKPQSFISRSETGDRRIDIIELKAFSRIYRKSIAYFLEGITDTD